MEMRDKPMDVVVADDNPVLLGVLCQIFGECGCNVRPAPDGFAALAELRKKVPDILLSDLSMPGMSGYELLSVVRRRFPVVRVIAMSGAHTGASIPLGVAADAFYAKGESSVAQLMQMVRTIWREEALPLRSTTPVWMPDISTDDDKAVVLLASCPECLHPCSHLRITGIDIRQRETCPHCLMSFELPIVRPTMAMEISPIPISVAGRGRSASTLESGRSGGAPTGRRYQQ